MKKSIFALALASLSFAATPAFAQQKTNNPANDSCVCAPAQHRCDADAPGRHRHQAKGHHGRYADSKRHGNPALRGIELSEAQQAQLKELNAERTKSMKEIGERTRKDIKKVREASDKKLEKILTPEQLKQYTDNKARMQANKDARKDFGKKNGRRFDKRRNQRHHHGYCETGSKLSAQR